LHAGLNKGEARNALARAVFFNRLGEIHDRSFEQQRYRPSGLNLVTAAIRNVLIRHFPLPSEPPVKNVIPKPRSHCYSCQKGRKIQSR